jgi:hypothetical protein
MIVDMRPKKEGALKLKIEESLSLQNKGILKKVR